MSKKKKSKLPFCIKVKRRGKPKKVGQVASKMMSFNLNILSMS